MVLFTDHLYDALATNSCICRDTFGVFASDQLPTFLPRRSYVIVNLDPIHKRGSHWVAIYNDNHHNVEFFDSYGNRPSFYPSISSFFDRRSYTHNPTQLQSLQSDLCGQFCLYFLFQRCCGFSLLQQVHRMFSGSPTRNDEMVNAFFTYNIRPVIDRFYDSPNYRLRREENHGRLQERPCKNDYPCGFQGCFPQCRVRRLQR